MASNAYYELGIPWYTNKVNLYYTVKDKFSNKTIEYEDNDVSLVGLTSKEIAKPNSKTMLVAGNSTGHGEPHSPQYDGREQAYHMGKVHSLIVKRNKEINNTNYTFPITLYQECYPDELIEKIDTNDILELHSFAYSYIALKHRYRNNNTADYYKYYSKPDILFGITSKDEEFNNSEYKEQSISDRYIYKLIPNSNTDIVNKVGIRTKELESIQDTVSAKAYDNIYIYPNIYKAPGTEYKYKTLLSAYYSRFIENIESYALYGPPSNIFPVIYGYEYSSYTINGFKYIWRQINEYKTPEEYNTEYYLNQQVPSYVVKCDFTYATIKDDEASEGVKYNSYTVNTNTININFKEAKKFEGQEQFTLTFKVGENIDPNTATYVSKDYFMKTYYYPTLVVNNLNFAYNALSYDINANNVNFYNDFMLKYFNLDETFGDSSNISYELFAAIKYDPHKLKNNVIVSPVTKTGETIKDGEGNLIFNTQFSVKTDSKNNVQYSLFNPEDEVKQIKWEGISSNNENFRISNLKGSTTYQILATYEVNGSNISKTKYSYVLNTVLSGDINSYITNDNIYIYKPDNGDCKLYLFDKSNKNEILYDKYNEHSSNDIFIYDNGNDSNDYPVINSKHSNNIENYLYSTVYNIYTKDVVNKYSYIHTDYYKTNDKIEVKLHNYKNTDDYNGAHIYRNLKDFYFTSVENGGTKYSENDDDYICNIIDRLFTPFVFNRQENVNEYKLQRPTINENYLGEIYDKYVNYTALGHNFNNEHEYDYNYLNEVVDESLVNKYYDKYIDTSNALNEYNKQNTNGQSLKLDNPESTTVSSGGIIVNKFSQTTIYSSLDKQQKQYYDEFIKPYDLLKLAWPADDNTSNKEADIFGNIYTINSFRYEYDNGSAHNHPQGKNYEIYTAEDEDSKLKWYNNPNNERSFLAYIYSGTQSDKYKEVSNYIQLKKYELGATYAYLYTYLVKEATIKKYAPDDIYIMSNITSSLEGLTSKITVDMNMAEWGSAGVTGENTWKSISEIDRTDVDNPNVLAIMGTNGLCEDIENNLAFYDEYIAKCKNEHDKLFNTNISFNDYCNTSYKYVGGGKKTPLIRYNGNIINTSNVNNYYSYSYYKTFNPDTPNENTVGKISLDETDYDKSLKKYINALNPLYDFLTSSNLKYIQVTNEYAKHGSTVSGSADVNEAQYEYKWVYKGRVSSFFSGSGSSHLGDSNYGAGRYNNTSSPLTPVTYNETEGKYYSGSTDVTNYYAFAWEQVKTHDASADFTFQGNFDESEYNRRWTTKDIYITSSKDISALLSMLNANIDTLFNTNNNVDIKVETEYDYAGVTQNFGEIENFTYYSGDGDTLTPHVATMSYIRILNTTISKYKTIVNTDTTNNITIDFNPFDDTFYMFDGTQQNINIVDTLINNIRSNSSVNPQSVVTEGIKYIRGTVWKIRDIIVRYFNRIAEYNEKLLQYSNELENEINVRFTEVSTRKKAENGEYAITDEYLYNYNYYANVDNNDSLDFIKSLEVIYKMHEIFKEITIKRQIKMHFQRALAYYKYQMFNSNDIKDDKLKDSIRNMHKKDSFRNEINSIIDSIYDILINVRNYSLSDYENNIYEFIIGNKDINYSYIFQILENIDNMTEDLSINTEFYNKFSIYYLNTDIYSLISDNASTNYVQTEGFHFRYVITDGDKAINNYTNIYHDTYDVKLFPGSIYIEYGELNSYNDPRLHILLYYYNSFVFELPLKNSKIKKPHWITPPVCEVNRLSDTIEIVFTVNDSEIEDIDWYMPSIECELTKYKIGTGTQEIFDNDTQTLTSETNQFSLKTSIDTDENGNVIPMIYKIQYHTKITGTNDYINQSKNEITIYYLTEEDDYKYERVDITGQGFNYNTEINSKYTNIDSIHLYTYTYTDTTGLYWVAEPDKNIINSTYFKLIEEVEENL